MELRSRHGLISWDRRLRSKLGLWRWCRYLVLRSRPGLACLGSRLGFGSRQRQVAWACRDQCERDRGRLPGRVATSASAIEKLCAQQCAVCARPRRCGRDLVLGVRTLHTTQF